MISRLQDELPIDIQAVGDINAEGVDHQAAIVLKYASGKIASLTTSVTADLPCEASVYGSAGYIKVNFGVKHPEHSRRNTLANFVSFIDFIYFVVGSSTKLT